MTFFNKKSNKLAFKAPLGMQRRNMMNRAKVVAQVIAAGAGAQIGANLVNAAQGKAAPKVQEATKVVVATVKSTINNGNGGDSTSEKVTSNAKAVGTSPDIPDWDLFRVLNPDWFAHSPFTFETTMDIITVALMLFIITLIIVFYVMWSSYFSNVATSFLIGEKRLPAYHLALISIAVLMSVFTLALVYLAAFTGMIVEAASLNGLSSDIAKLEGEIEELRTLLEVYSKKS